MRSISLFPRGSGSAAWRISSSTSSCTLLTSSLPSKIFMVPACLKSPKLWICSCLSHFLSSSTIGLSMKSLCLTHKLCTHGQALTTDTTWSIHISISLNEILQLPSNIPKARQTHVLVALCMKFECSFSGSKGYKCMFKIYKLHLRSVCSVALRG